jgi:hypothetical protein
MKTKIYTLDDEKQRSFNSEIWIKNRKGIYGIYFKNFLGETRIWCFYDSYLDCKHTFKYMMKYGLYISKSSYDLNFK